MVYLVCVIPKLWYKLFTKCRMCDMTQIACQFNFQCGKVQYDKLCFANDIGLFYCIKSVRSVICTKQILISCNFNFERFTRTNCDTSLS